MSMHPIWYLFIIVVIDLIIFAIADYLNMKNTQAQRIFWIVFSSIINILILHLGDIV